ncbi:MAG: PQQ-binding-like beta-propeller repeat protein [bacterium]
MFAACESTHRVEANSRHNRWQAGDPITQPAPLWTATIESDVVGPPVVHGDVFVASRDAVTRLSVGDGSQVWRVEVPCTGAPTWFNGRVVVGTAKGVVALDATSGETLWETALDGAVTSSSTVSTTLFVPTFRGEFVSISEDGGVNWRARTAGAIAGSPAVDDDSIAAASADGFLYVLDRQTGELRWKWEAPRGLDTSPTLTDTQVLLGVADGSVLAFDSKTGKLNWSNPTRSAVVSTPLVAAELVVVATIDGQLLAVNARTGAVQWEQQIDAGMWFGPVGRGDSLVSVAGAQLQGRQVSTGKQDWAIDLAAEIRYAPVIADALVVVVAGTQVVALQAPKP